MDLRQETGHVFGHPAATKPSTDDHDCKRLLAKTGVPEHLHAARHMAATVLLLLNVPGER
jgi:hypothetical protein